MTTSPRSCRILATLSIAGLAWIVNLSLALRQFFDADLSGGWLIAGTMLSAVAIGILVMIKQFTEAIVEPYCFDRFQRVAHSGRNASQPRPDSRHDGRNLFDQSFALPRRNALGLGPQQSLANRRRSSRHLASV